MVTQDGPYPTTLATPGALAYGRSRCHCEAHNHGLRLIAVTGGPGAGKTAVLRVAQQVFCQHVICLPEAATIVFSGGFWRISTIAGRKAAQRVIFAAQRQLEWLLAEEQLAAIGLCDRGTVDGAAYWPGAAAELWSDVATTREQEMARYAAVIHLRTPAANNGYNHQNPVRTEDAREASRLDEAILAAWDGHPQRVIIEATETFDVKVTKTLAVIRTHIAPCCT